MAHYWSRELTKLGHEVRLTTPQYVCPFVKREKNDPVDRTMTSMTNRSRSKKRWRN